MQEEENNVDQATIKRTWYAVHKGHHIGVYETWEGCKAQILGFGKPSYRKCITRGDAEEFVRTGKLTPNGECIELELSINLQGWKVTRIEDKDTVMEHEVDDEDKQDLIPTTKMYLSAATAALHWIKFKRIRRVKLIHDSPYLHSVLTTWLKMWSKNKWRKSSGSGKLRHVSLLMQLHQATHGLTISSRLLSTASSSCSSSSVSSSSQVGELLP
jgi:viroplasmin and RNaseH domain-containing protein